MTACNSKTNEAGQGNDNSLKSAAAIENIMTRTSVRSYTDQPVSEETLDTLLRAGMAAPTAVNKQPWEFVVVNEQAVKDSLVNHLKNGHMIAKAPVSIVVCGNLQKALENEAAAYWVQDCSAATENILLAANAVGLGAVWCGVYPIQERVVDVRTVLNLPDHLIPLNVIAIGYPDKPHAPKDKWNPDNVHFNTYK